MGQVSSYYSYTSSNFHTTVSGSSVNVQDLNTGQAIAMTPGIVKYTQPGLDAKFVFDTNAIGMYTPDGNITVNIHDSRCDTTGQLANNLIDRR